MLASANTRYVLHTESRRLVMAIFMCHTAILSHTLYRYLSVRLLQSVMSFQAWIYW